MSHQETQLSYETVNESNEVDTLELQQTAKA